MLLPVLKKLRKKLTFNFFLKKISIEIALTTFCFIFWHLDKIVYNKIRITSTKLKLQYIKNLLI